MLKEFFKPTRQYYQYVIFNLLASNSSYTQREIATKLNIAASTVNYLIDFYVTDGFITKTNDSTRDMKYILTDKGKNHAKLLNIKYLSNTQKLYNNAKNEVGVYLDEFVDRGYKRLVFYGAGEVCELLLNTIKEDYNSKLEVIAVIDDNIDKQDTLLVNTLITSFNSLNSLTYDALLISTYTNHEEIYNKLVNSGYDINKILYFFK